jgi:hypothetical protein
MSNKVILIVDRQATGNKVLVFLLLQMLMSGLMFGISHRFGLLAQGTMPLDVTLFYGIDSARQFFATVPGAAAQYYMQVLFPLDLIYPALYSFSYALIVAWLLRKLAQRGLVYPQWLVLYPFASALFDYLENIGMVSLFRQHEVLSEVLLSATTLCSGLKWFGAFSGLSMLVYLSFKLVTTRSDRVGRLS